ncbi:hypothetical protein MSKU15_0166 [Komagataeibacter diospyri]|nr:hypothetical protein MSKU15_0166 [Komagataeibacter diospyri]
MVSEGKRQRGLCGRQSRDPAAVVCEGDKRPFGCDVGEATEMEADEAHGALDDAENRFDGLLA